MGDQARTADGLTVLRAILRRHRNRIAIRRETGPGRVLVMRRTAGGMAVLLALASVAGAIRLHTELEDSDPAADAVLTESPAAVTLAYTTEVQLAISSVTVTSASTNGVPASAGDLAYLFADRHDVLVLPLTAPLSSGSYIVSWRTAGPDGHPISGEFGFRVDLPVEEEIEEIEEVEEGDVTGAGDPPVAGGTERDPAAREDALAAEAGPSVDILALATRFAFYAAIVGILGAIAFRALVLRAVGGGLPETAAGAVAEGVWRIAAIAAGLLLLTLPLRLWFQAVSFFPEDPLGNLGAVTAGTAWSTGWWVQVTAGAVVLLGVALARPGQHRVANGWRLAALGALALPIVPLVSGHAWADSPRALSSVATYLHVVAASAWVGGLCCLVCAGLPALRDSERPADGVPAPLPALVGAFSRLALAAAGLLVVSGAAKAWLHIGAPSDLWTTAWGRSLLVKDAVVLGVMALGFYNWRVVRPALASDPGPDRLKRSATLELLLGAAAVIATSFLVVQPLN